MEAQTEFKGTIEDICSSSQAYVVKQQELEDKHFGLKNDLANKIEELRELDENNMALNDRLKSHQLQVQDLEQMQADGSTFMLSLRNSIDDLRKEISDERKILDGDLVAYEAKVQTLTQTIIEAPQRFDTKVLYDEMEKMRASQSEVTTELDEIKAKLDELRELYRDDVHKETTEEDCMKVFMSEIEAETQNRESEVARICKDLESLDELSKQLQWDLQKLKLQAN